jgi:hypothetical protein
LNLLDENILKDQRELLHSWRIPVHQIGHDAGRKGMKDDEIIPLLQQLTRPTFFTRDFGFYNRKLCHARYCIVYTAVDRSEVAVFMRRLLRHPDLKAEADRLGKVMRLSSAGISIWQLHAEAETLLDWRD